MRLSAFASAVTTHERENRSKHIDESERERQNKAWFQAQMSESSYFVKPNANDREILLERAASSELLKASRDPQRKEKGEKTNEIENGWIECVKTT